ncbi:hypothetical protein FO519_009382 [Halicephalobus sp. NKZ332]|nr:hypothetical protein FO519_009382 [Halicephalobus sp. NKZ332]
MGSNILKFAILAIILYQFAASVPLSSHKFDIEKAKEALATNPKALNCDVCKLLIGGLRLLIEQNKTDEELDKFAIDTCINFKIEQPHVCRAIVNNLGNELYFVVENSFLEPHEFCGLIIKNCSQAENPFNQPWPLQIPGNKPPVKPWPIPEMYYDDANPKNRATHVAFVAPSLTTSNFLNPAYRVYTIDGNYEGSTFTVLDEDNYWVNITDANLKGELKFELEYNKKKTFGLKDMSPESFNDLLQRMLTDESLLDKYITYFNRNNVQLQGCDSKCKKQYVCQAMTGESGKEDIFCAGIN